MGLTTSLEEVEEALDREDATADGPACPGSGTGECAGVNACCDDSEVEDAQLERRGDSESKVMIDADEG